MFITALLHRVADYLLSCLHLCQNREVGWLTLDRRTGELKREQQPLLKKLKLILLFNPLTEWIDQTHLMRLWLHEKTVKSGNSSHRSRTYFLCLAETIPDY
jgi:hypothetical protein